MSSLAAACSPHPAAQLETRNEKTETAFQPAAVPQLETRNQKLETILRLGLRYARGLREDAAHALVRARTAVGPFTSIDDLTRRVPELRKHELLLLAEIGALNSLAAPAAPPEHPLPRHGGPENVVYRSSAGGANSFRAITNHKSQIVNRLHRRSAIWQIERATRPARPLLHVLPAPPEESPLSPMTPEERLVADFQGTGLTIGPHPLAYHRPQLELQRVRRAADLPQLPSGRQVRIAGCVIARQRPGTAHGFVFLSLEDETGIANAIVTPQMFEQHRFLVTSARFLLIEGELQNQENVVSVKAAHIRPLEFTQAATSSHDFH